MKQTFPILKSENLSKELDSIEYYMVIQNEYLHSKEDHFGVCKRQAIHLNIRMHYLKMNEFSLFSVTHIWNDVYYLLLEMELFIK